MVTSDSPRAVLLGPLAIALKALGKLDVVREDSAPGGPQFTVVLGATVDPVTGRELSPSVTQDFHRLTLESAVAAVPPDPTDV